MNPALQLFLTVTLPIMVTIAVAQWQTNRRLSELAAIIEACSVDMHRGLDRMTADPNSPISR